MRSVALFLVVSILQSSGVVLVQGLLVLLGLRLDVLWLQEHGCFLKIGSCVWVNFSIVRGGAFAYLFTLLKK